VEGILVQAISDNDLADVEAIVAGGRSVPAIIVRAILQRLRDAEAQHAPRDEAPRSLIAA
jgi:hypothetical protein